MHDKLFLYKLYLIEQLKTSNKYNPTLEEFVISLSKQNIKKIFLESKKSDAILLQRLDRFEKIVEDYINKPLKILAVGLEDIIPPTRKGQIIKHTISTIENEKYRHAFVKAVTYLILRAKSVCIKNHRNDPIKKNQCFINGLNTLINHLKSEFNGCDKTRNPIKCKRRIESKINEMTEDINVYREQIKNLRVKVK